MIKVGITGQKGFIGNYLYNTLGLFPELFERIDFQKDFFNDNNQLDKFVSQCEVIIHLAAVNRHSDLQELHETNLNLVKILVASLDRNNSKAHIIMSSSIQENLGNFYGKSKKEGREIIANWAQRNNVCFTGLIIPNVFGPFGKPNYNSVISTFCCQLIQGIPSLIDVDSELNLIYIDELVQEIIKVIRDKINNVYYEILPTAKYKVSDVLKSLDLFKQVYFKKGEIPHLKTEFDINLFNTFRSYINIETQFPLPLLENKDDRGAFTEIIRLGIGGQVSISTTLPGITRGNHFHTRKIERFAVIKGKAMIQLRRIGTDKVIEFYLDGKEPTYIDMPIWYTHNIMNIGKDILYTVFWINEPYNINDPDTYLEIV